MDLTKLDEQLDNLKQQALAVRMRAYAPYSNFFVGAAVLASDGTIYTGCNVENAAYGSTLCAERVALTAAIAGGARAGQFLAIAVVGDTDQPITPCGACRQVIAELCPPQMPVWMGNTKGIWKSIPVQALLPGAFTRAVLNREEHSETDV